MIVDEEFKKVTSSFHMGAVQVPLITGATQKQPLIGPAGMTVRRNGWLYVYVSNESGQEVYFDDLIIYHQRGPVVEMNNYYPFGLEIPGLASKAIGFGGNSDNRIKYNGKELQSKEFNDGSGLTWDDYGARMYDPQIGRWMVNDPMSEKSYNSSPYVYGNNNPISMIDVAGKYAVSVHYNITYSELIKLGYSKERADLIAHYASVYADHPTDKTMRTDHTFRNPFVSQNPYVYRSGIDYTPTSESQDEKNSTWHSMMSDEEAKNGMTEDQALLRGLQFGWDKIFEAGATEEGKDLGSLGQGLHAFQDAAAHMGIQTNDHLGYNFSSTKKLLNDAYGNTSFAHVLTRSALIVVDVLKGKKANLKDGDTLDLRGMSNGQMTQFLQALLKQGFKGTVYNTQNH